MSTEIKKHPVTMIRVYTDDSNGHIHKMLEKLQNRDDVIGATIFRGIAGLGKHGTHESTLLDLSAHLPIVIEFYHKSSDSEKLIAFVHEQIKKAHIISWEVNLSFETLD